MKTILKKVGQESSVPHCWGEIPWCLESSFLGSHVPGRREVSSDPKRHAGKVFERQGQIGVMFFDLNSSRDAKIYTK